MADFTVDNDDLNGDCFIAGAEGEPEIELDTNVYQFARGFQGIGDDGALTAVDVPLADANRFVKLNYIHLIACGRSADVAAKVAYVRLLAVKNGLVSPGFTMAAHNVRYNNCNILAGDPLTGDDSDYNDAAKADLMRVLTPDVRKRLRMNFSDYTCCVAYIFRVRGHHYKDEFEDRYKTLWSRCLKQEGDLPLTWQHVATDALHAIMPDVLDRFWANCVQASRCAGTLIKRYDSAPAGCAGVFALKRGLDDVMMLFPAIVQRVPSAHEAFETVLANLGTSRWGGSINCRFYGVNRIRVDESKIGALASVVMGIYDNLAQDSKLRDSPALKRLAEIAPATGGALGIAAMRATKDESLSLIRATDAQN